MDIMNTNEKVKSVKAVIMSEDVAKKEKYDFLSTMKAMQGKLVDWTDTMMWIKPVYVNHNGFSMLLSLAIGDTKVQAEINADRIKDFYHHYHDLADLRHKVKIANQFITADAVPDREIIIDGYHYLVYFDKKVIRDTTGKTIVDYSTLPNLANIDKDKLIDFLTALLTPNKVKVGDAVQHKH